MPLFVLFVFGAVILGAGAMLSPAWPTAQPRIGLAAAISLALVVGGTIFYASLFGWDTLVIDYLMFALMTSIFLGGTLSIGQTRAEARGEELLDKEQGWPGPQDLSALALWAVVLTWVALMLPVPFGEAAQAHGLIALAMREGGTLNTLAPFAAVEHLTAPGFNALSAYLSQQLNVGVHTVQLAAGAVMALICVWLAYDFGAELRDKRLGRAIAQVMVGSLGVFGLLINGHYPAIMGTAFTFACFLYALRYMRHRYPADLVGVGLLMGATFISDLTAFTVLAGGFVAFLGAMWLGTNADIYKRGTWVRLALIAPLIALAGVAPWLADVWGLFTGGLEAPYERSIDNLYVLAQNHGLWVWPLAVLGAWLAWNRRLIKEEGIIALWAAAWLVLIFDFAISGGVAALLGFLTRYADPALVAWQGAVIPVSILGGMAALWLWDEQVQPRTSYRMTYRQTYALSGAGVLILLALSQPLREVLATISPPSYATRDDVAALVWVRENTAEDARLHSLPQPQSGNEWLTPIAERASTRYASIPFVRAPLSEGDAFLDWADGDALRASGVTHVFLPQALSREFSGSLSSAAHLQDIYEGRVFAVTEGD